MGNAREVQAAGMTLSSSGGAGAGRAGAGNGFMKRSS